jgi:hypothetical protein
MRSISLKAAKEEFDTEWGELVQQNISGTILVPESDSRPAVDLSPEGDFDDVSS